MNFPNGEITPAQLTYDFNAPTTPADDFRRAFEALNRSNGNRLWLTESSAQVNRFTVERASQIGGGVVLGVGLAALVSQFSGYSASGGAVIGHLPSGLPSPYWPGFPGWDALGSLMVALNQQMPELGWRLLADALELFFKLREPASGLRKRPATAELIGWLIALREIGAPADQSLRQNGAAALGSLSSLIKSADDQDTARKIVENWLK